MKRFPFFLGRISHFPVLILLTSCLLWILAPMWNPQFWYYLDTGTVFQIFYAHYNNFFYHHELAQWFPYGLLGTQSDYAQLYTHTPAHYLVILLGFLARMTDVNLIFKCAVLLDHILFAAGAYLLGLRLYRTKTAAAFVSLGLAGSCLGMANIFWNFRLAYLLPWTLYCFHVSLEEGKPKFLAAALIFLLAGHLGVPAYYPFFHLLLAGLYFIFLGAAHPQKVKELLRINPKTVMAFILAGLIAWGLCRFSLHVYDGLQTYHEGRTRGTYQVSLDDFKTFGPEISPAKFLNFFVPGYLGPVGINFYTGLIPVALLLFGLLRVKRIMFRIWITLSLFLLLLSLGFHTAVADALYFTCPPMRYFRYLGVIAAPIRLALLISAGFGLDHLLCPDKDNSRTKDSLALTVSCLAAAGTSYFLIRSPFLASLSHWMLWPDLTGFEWARVALTAALFTLPLKFRGAAGGAVLILLASHLHAFQNRFYDTWPYRISLSDHDILKTSEFSYQKMRAFNPPDGSRARRAQLLAETTPSKFQKEIFNFILFDTTHTERYHIFEKNTLVARFLELTRSSCAPTGGCDKPKLRLVTDIAFAQNDREAEAFIPQLAQDSGKVILQNVPKSQRTAWQKNSPTTASGDIRVNRFTFNSVKAEIQVDNPNGAWLYYADAYHPGWKALVDGQKSAVYAANLAFKAVYAPYGKHLVELKFQNGLQSLLSYAIALFGILCCLAFPALMYRELSSSSSPVRPTIKK